MSTDNLQYHGLNVAETASKLVDAIKKVDGHGHDPDWRHMIDLAMGAIAALSGFVAYAEARVEEADA
jgi:hypothetical protein